MIAMLLGALGSTLTVAWVLYPIFAARSRPPAPSASSEPEDDAVEALIRRYRPAGAHCPSCGPRPESDAAFCSSCGRPLGGGSAQPS
jgi:hypothetical protein